MRALVRQLATVAASNPSGNILWIADEHELPSDFFPIAKTHGIDVLSNRYDQYQALLSQGVSATFSDFDFDALPTHPYDHFFFRVAKERPIVHRVINETARTAPEGATLWLAGHKSQGIKTLVKKTEQRFSTNATISRGPNQHWTAACLYRDSHATPLDDMDYAQLRRVETPHASFWSKPGVFGWNKIDVGSDALVSWIAQKPGRLEGKSVLDLGCGYGYLSQQAAAMGASRIVATDNCAAAITACEKNLDGSASSVDVVASNAGIGIDETFDVILCNPPFHQGFSTTPALHNRFTREIKRMMKSGGVAWLVVNQFLDIDTVAKTNGLTVRPLSSADGFKILALT